MPKKKMTKCPLCSVVVPAGINARRYCSECRRRSSHAPLKILRAECQVCGIKGPWLMEQHAGEAICGNCHRFLHRGPGVSKSRSVQQAKLDIAKSVLGCATCGEQHPNKLLFVDSELNKISVNPRLSKTTLTKRINGASVFCWNCWWTNRRSNALCP